MKNEEQQKKGLLTGLQKQGGYNKKGMDKRERERQCVYVSRANQESATKHRKGLSCKGDRSRTRNAQSGSLLQRNGMDKRKGGYCIPFFLKSENHAARRRKGCRSYCVVVLLFSTTESFLSLCDN
jgi:hypothetical protein